MFIKELQLYIAYLSEQVESASQDEKRILYCIRFAENLLNGIIYYRSLKIGYGQRVFASDLDNAENLINSMIDCYQVKQEV